MAMRFLIAAFLLVMPSVAFSGPMEVPAGALCIECGMKVDPASPFTAQIIRGGKLYVFCDIGDMLSYYAGLKKKPSEVYVKDYEYNAWMGGLEAYYVKGEYFKSPMGWRIAAFRNKVDALKAGAVMTFNEALEMFAGGEKPTKSRTRSH